MYKCFITFSNAIFFCRGFGDMRWAKTQHGNVKKCPCCGKWVYPVFVAAQWEKPSVCFGAVRMSLLPCQIHCKLPFHLSSCLCLSHCTGMHIFCLTASLVLAHAISADLITRFSRLIKKKWQSGRIEKERQGRVGRADPWGHVFMLEEWNPTV